MNTIERIQAILKEEGIREWRVTEVTEESAESYFVKKQLDTRRIKDVTKYAVTVFRTEEAGKGFTEVLLPADPTDETIRREIRGAYYAAQYALNPPYEQPKPEKAPLVKATGKLAEVSAADAANAMAAAAFSADSRSKAFLNSLEIFIHKKKARILSSEGTDVSWESVLADGEYVVQCKEPEDVELFVLFAYDDLDTEALNRKVSDSLTYAADRAQAKKCLKTGEYDVILSEDDLASLLSFYLARTNAQYKFAGYSRWTPGDDLQNAEGAGEPIDLTLAVKAPYSGEGIAMKERTLLAGGKLSTFWGGNRFSQYIKAEPTGDYRAIRCENAGSLTVQAMQEQWKKTGRPVLMPILFSDFDVDIFGGSFGGEMRLAYLYDENGVTAVTGGTINGRLFEAQKTIRFSEERYKRASSGSVLDAPAYEGPRAALLERVQVAGL